MHQAHLRIEDFLFPTRLHASDHLSTRQYARIVKAWVTAIGLDPTMYGTHTTSNQSIADLSQDEEPESCPASAWAHEA